MGAKIMPMPKNNGRTVFGVRMGLAFGQLQLCSYSRRIPSPVRTAMPSISVDETPCLSR